MFDAPRLTVALTFDHDAIAESVRRGDPPVKLSHARVRPSGRAAADPRAARPRRDPGDLLRARATRSSRSPRTPTRSSKAATNWRATAGITRTSTELTPGEEAEILGRSIEAVAERTGAPPAGYRAPYWALSPATLGLVEAAGFRYDSSLMADDYRLFRVRHGDRHSVGGRDGLGRAGRAGRGARLLDPGRLAALRAERRARRTSTAVAVLEIWLAELNYAYGHSDGGVLTITMHPECIGRGHRMAMLETFIEQASALPGVEFERLDAVVARWSAASRPAESELGVNAGSQAPASSSAPAATSFARRRTASNIGGVSRPVNVFCWLGWYEPSRT